MILFFGIVTTLLLAGIVCLGRSLKSLRRENSLLHKTTAILETDLADRRVIERELAHMASFADMAPNPIIEINRERAIGYVNPAAEQTFPTLASMGLKHPLFEGVMSAVDLLARKGRMLMTRLIKIDEHVYEQQIALLDGGPRVRLYMSDITELKRLDQLKSDFVNMVSHELRTPLTAIAASIKMLTGGMLGALKEDQTKALHLAEINIDRLTRMINDLLDVSKIEAGKLELHRARVDLIALVKDVSLSFEPLARERGLHIRTQLPREPIEILIDRDKIFQVFANLINNALKFTEDGYVEISASAHDGEVSCQVSDTGPGIALADLPNVFGKFQQFAPAAKGREKGTGLGLSLCKGFIELHEGKIWAENRSPRGAQITFVLPRLSPSDLFYAEVRRLFSEAVTTGKPLSLLRLTLPGWESVRPLENTLMAMIQTVVRGPSELVFHKDGILLMALPYAPKATAFEIAQRIEKKWCESSVMPATERPREVTIQVVSYPDDGNLVEELYARLTACR